MVGFLWLGFHGWFFKSGFLWFGFYSCSLWLGFYG